MVTKNLVLARQIAGIASCIVLPCPALESPTPIGREPGSYADILAMHGFGDSRVFKALCGAWQDIFSMTGADLLIADHAPLALVSARMAGLPSIHVGDGFTVPPLLAPLPGFRPDAVATHSARMALEAGMLGMINQHLALAGRTSCEMLAQAFQGDVTLLATIPELDPYAISRQACAHFIGKIPYQTTHAQPRWAGSSRPRIFVYLSAHGSCISVLDRLATSAVEAIAVVPGMPDAAARRYEGNTDLRVYNAFIQTDAILPACDVLIAHGGQGITLESLRYGVPLLLLPNHMEQLLTTACIARASAGLGILPEYVQQRFSGVLDTLLNDGQYRLGAQALQEKYWNEKSRCALDTAMSHIC